MSGFTPDILRTLREHGCILVRHGKGDHEIWFSPITKRHFPLDSHIKSRHTANGMLEQAGFQNNSDSHSLIPPSADSPPTSGRATTPAAPPLILISCSAVLRKPSTGRATGACSGWTPTCGKKPLPPGSLFLDPLRKTVLSFLRSPKTQSRLSRV